jgi:hypothetical protein
MQGEYPGAILIAEYERCRFHHRQRPDDRHWDAGNRPVNGVVEDGRVKAARTEGGNKDRDLPMQGMAKEADAD